MEDPRAEIVPGWPLASLGYFTMAATVGSAAGRRQPGQEGICGGRLGPYPELVEQGAGLPAELVVPDALGDEVDPGSVDKRDQGGTVH